MYNKLPHMHECMCPCAYSLSIVHPLLVIITKEQVRCVVQLYFNRVVCKIRLNIYPAVLSLFFSLPHVNGLSTPCAYLLYIYLLIKKNQRASGKFVGGYNTIS